jgi:hypothetical protein
VWCFGLKNDFSSGKNQFTIAKNFLISKQKNKQKQKNKAVK